MRKSTPPACAVNYFAGIDYHKKFSMITVGDAEGNVLVTERVSNDKEMIRRFFAKFQPTECAVESCRGYEWFVDYLKELGLIVHLSDPYRTKVIAQTRCKTDKVDSRILMQLLAIRFLPTCYQPTAYEREVRERLRWRAHLVRSATRVKLQIRTLLDKENLREFFPKGFTKSARKQILEAPVSPARKTLISQQLSLLERFEEMVKAEDDWCEAQTKNSEVAMRLRTVPGIGPLTALLLIAELGWVSRFKTSRQVAAYVGLVPSVHSSADVYRTGPITKQGSSHLRWMLIQCAWQAIKYSVPLRMHFASVTKRCGKQSAIVSVARKLLRISFRVMRDGKEFAPELVGFQSA